MTDMRSNELPRIALIHTTPLVLPAVEGAILSLKNKYDFFHTLDEALLYRIMKDGNSADLVVPWLQTLVDQAVKGDAQAVIVTCSSLSPYVQEVNEKSTVPVIRVDEMMYINVAKTTENPAVLMTNPSNEIPAALLAKETEEGLGLMKPIPINICPGAFDALKAGDTDKHDQAVIREVDSMLQKHDAVMFSQISMARVRDLLAAEQQARVHVSLDYLEQILGESLSSYR
ncbi:aspartate/glutamate racemase family protein [Oceanispirochaeta sp. M1]|uniref:aspartate/glutamate racemase family protein n=2 Tax=Oceanispirochaeta TaxID=2035349 RepID=UPI001495408F|nr:aspartate/glutamate racemase family protein [Oceanispirochaeta sp. M1]